MIESLYSTKNDDIYASVKIKHRKKDGVFSSRISLAIQQVLIESKKSSYDAIFFTDIVIKDCQTSSK